MRTCKAILLFFLSLLAVKARAQEDSAIYLSLQLVGSPLFSNSNSTFREGALLVLGDHDIRIRAGILFDIEPEYLVHMPTSMAPPQTIDTSSYTSLIIPVMIDYSFIVREKWYSYLSFEVMHGTLQHEKQNSPTITHFDYFHYGTFFSRLGVGVNWIWTSRINFFCEPYICYSPSSFYDRVIFPGNTTPSIFLLGALFGVSINLFKYTPK